MDTQEKLSGVNLIQDNAITVDDIASAWAKSKCSVLHELSQAQAARGVIQGALNTASLIEDDYYRLLALNYIGGEIIKRNKEYIERAKEVK